ncbi:MAG: hypothetical protein II882_07270 [Lachnospiraceae bacterium]|nr:hypothetical protein [Lachnospiraceae bacterium]
MNESKTRWMDAVSELDASLLQNALEYEKKLETPAVRNKRKFPLALKILIPAACLALILLFVPPLFSKEPADGHYPHWADLNAAQEGVPESRYMACFAAGPYQNYTCSRVCAEEAVGEKLGEETLTAGWYSYTGGVPSDPPASPESLRAEIFSLKGASAQAAVCVRFLDQGEALTTDHWYTYINRSYTAGTLSEMLADFGGKEALSVKTDSLLFLRDEKGTILRSGGKLSAQGASALMDAVLALRGEACPYPAASSEVLDRCTAQAVLRLEDLPYGYKLQMTVLDSGYVSFDFPDSSPSGQALTFSIGQKEAAALLEQLHRAAETAGLEGETVTGSTQR